MPEHNNDYRLKAENPYEELEQKLEAEDYKKTLYRESNIGGIYLLWMDKTLPLKYFKGSHQSGMTADTLTNFWFDRPMVFDKTHFEFLLKTDLNKWPHRPKYFGKGKMHYKEPGPTDPFSPPNLKTIDEYYLGDVVPIDLLEIYTPVSSYGDYYEKKILPGFNKILGKIKSGNHLKITEWSVGELETNDEEEREAFQIIYKIFHEALCEEKLRDRSASNLKKEDREQRFKEFARQLNDFLNKPEEIEKINQFYNWVLTLPKTGYGQVGDLNTPANWDLEVEPTTKKIIKKPRKVF